MTTMATKARMLAPAPACALCLGAAAPLAGPRVPAGVAWLSNQEMGMWLRVQGQVQWWWALQQAAHLREVLCGPLPLLSAAGPRLTAPALQRPQSRPRARPLL